jgi:UDP-3-O-[3-hydroxymyristoyl] glucosamine N-acyltransferase
VQHNTIIDKGILKDSMIGNHAKFEGKKLNLSIGDYSVMSE